MNSSSLFPHGKNGTSQICSISLLFLIFNTGLWHKNIIKYLRTSFYSFIFTWELCEAAYGSRRAENLYCCFPSLAILGALWRSESVHPYECSSLCSHQT